MSDRRAWRATQRDRTRTALFRCPASLRSSLAYRSRTASIPGAGPVQVGTPAESPRAHARQAGPSQSSRRLLGRRSRPGGGLSRGARRRASDGARTAYAGRANDGRCIVCGRPVRPDRLAGSLGHVALERPTPCGGTGPGDRAGRSPRLCAAPLQTSRRRDHRLLRVLLGGTAMSQTPRHSVSVAAVVTDDNDRVLVIQRRDNGAWQLPGGVLELDESPDAGVRREVREETGIDVAPQRLTGVYKNMALGVVALVFRAHIVSGTPTPTEESAAVECGASAR